ncbi:MAG: transposase, partial [Acidobacteriota bacterium]|nr:transposase [Acidobacteriota bacterium]
LYLERHLRDTWTELTYQDEQPPHRSDPVAKANRSPAAQHKAATKRTSTGQPAHSFTSLLAELATQTRNTIALPGTDATFDKLTEPTPLQARALELARA